MASGVLPSPFKDATLRLPLISTQSAARLTNTKQAQLPSEERVGDALRDSEEVLAVYSSDAVELVQLTRPMVTWRHGNGTALVMDISACFKVLVNEPEDEALRWALLKLRQLGICRDTFVETLC